MCQAWGRRDSAASLFTSPSAVRSFSRRAADSRIRFAVQARLFVVKLLVVHLPGQMFGAYELGHLVRWGSIRSGATATATPAGRTI